MELMPDEKVLLTSDNKEVTLTTHRVRGQTKQWGKASCKSIMLEELCSCEVLYSSSPLLGILSILSLIVGGLIGTNTGESYIFYIGLIIAVLFIVIYFMSRQGTISLASSGITIKTRASGLSFDKMIQFIDKVEAAKNQRYLTLRT